MIEKVSAVFGFDAEILEHNLRENRHNSMTATYYLGSLLMKRGVKVEKNFQAPQQIETQHLK